MERLLDDISFSASESNAETESLIISAEYVETQLGELSKDEDLSRFIL